MIIDHIYENIIKKLTTEGRIEDYSTELRNKDNHADRVLYVYKIFDDLNYFPNTLDVKKCENTSVLYRNQGNKCYTKKELYKAWQYYNLSLLHAPLNSESYCLALSNRSAVLFELHKYVGCLQDIDLCFTYTYSDKIKDKLLNRKKFCLEAINRIKKQDDNIDIQNILSFKNQMNEQYVGASTKLTVAYTEQLGRHVIAKEDIQVGELLVEESPYSQIVVRDQMLFACHHCFSRNPHLIPCQHCCFALYCSEECKSNSWKDYHCIECPIIPTLIDMSFTKIELMALRIVIKARNDHNDWKSLYKTIEDAELHRDTEFNGHVNVDGNWVYDSKYYTSIHTLATNFELRSISDIFQKCVTAAVFLKFLLDRTDFLEAVNDEVKNERCQCVAELLLLHIMTAPTNMHSITGNIDDGEGKYVSELNIGAGAFAFHSLFNHSCAPNAVRFTELGSNKMKLFALRPIKKGMQIFDNYGVHHAVTSYVDRQSSLRFQYKFLCMCEACVDNWPTYLSLGMHHKKRIPHKIIRAKNKWLSLSNIDKLQYGDIDVVSKIYHNICSLCEELEKFAPCLELCDCQEALKQCLFILQGLIPYGYSQTVDWKLKGL